MTTFATAADLKAIEALSLVGTYVDPSSPSIQYAEAGRRFYVKCDDETNPKEVRDAGMVVIECGVAPVRPAEYLVFRVQAEVPQASQAGE